MQTFGKQEHLCSYTDIRKLFTEGNSFFRYPIKVYWLPGEWVDGPALKVLVSVSKRNFKKSVDRNHIKRLLRECYRKNKHLAFEGLNGRTCMMAMVYTGGTIPEINSLEPIIIRLLQRLIKDYETIAG